MRTTRAGLAALLGSLAVAAAVAAAEEPAAPRGGLFAAWFGPGKAEAPPAGPPAPQGLSPARLVAEMQREEQASIRRMKVCDQLRAVALQTNNEELLALVDRLDARITEVYRQRIEALQRAGVGVPEDVSDDAPTGARKFGKRSSAAQEVEP